MQDYLTPKEYNLMMHAIGYDLHAAEPYRNYYAIYFATATEVILDKLLVRGLTSRSDLSRKRSYGDLVNYHVTDAGIKLLKEYRQA